MIGDKFILVNKEVRPATLLEWAEWYETADRRVARTQIDDVVVSTVFLGLNMRYGGDGPPLVFETMIFGGQKDGYQERMCTWDEAEANHKMAVAMVEATR